MVWGGYSAPSGGRDRTGKHGDNCYKMNAIWCDAQLSVSQEGSVISLLMKSHDDTHDEMKDTKRETKLGVESVCEKRAW